MRPEIRQFFESYREAFDRLDAEAIAHHFCVPSMIVSGDGCTLFTDAGQIRTNMIALCARYRAHGFATATFEPGGFIDQPPDHAVADLLWTIRRRDGFPPWSFRTGYNLRRVANGWRVLLCTAYEEERLTA